ncbi:NAD(P)H-binding protein [uncultured Vibrio sp.]|uniref:NAD(P)H-binding protein n=1 Tax=uncultured Vibrio sp. TaxID=114054 RepID=UPI0029C8EEC0|nr:NAD(P)H-binding protein [uncultured Vibrio sp.]
MANIFVIGATGGVGQYLCPMLTNNGHQVTGLHRSQDQAETLRIQGVLPVKGDLMNMTSEQLTDMTKNSDVIVFTAGAAGSGVDRTSMIDGLGPVKMIEAAAANGIKRIYLVSAFPESARNDNLGAAFEHYMRVKKEADVAVANSGLDWVIIRPGTLLHADADNHVTLGSAIQYGTVKRGNVASVIAKLIDTPTIRREVLELTDGDISVDEAVNKISHLR